MFKRGLSHIEVILAFILFVGAAVSAIYFFNPGNSSRLVSSSLDYAYREIIKNTSIDLLTYSIVINRTVAIPGVLAFNISGVPPNMNVATTNDNGLSFNSKRSNDLISVEADFVNNRFFILRLGEDINNSNSLPASSGIYNRTYYQISSVTSESLVSELRINLLKEAYQGNYPNLKNLFNLPGRINFGFSLIFADGSNLTAETNTYSKEVYANKKSVKVLRLNGKEEQADLITQVW